MASNKIHTFFLVILFSVTVICEDVNNTINNPDNIFNGVYTECFFHLSYSCLQKKTLLYLKELNNLSEVSVIGEYVKFVKINTTDPYEDEELSLGSTDELAFMIDKAVDDFFNNHILKFNALGRDISLPRNMDEFVGRKKRKGGGGGGGGGGHGGHDDGGKKKMMMMAMMCMKMKLMMMVPAMMGMMGMMSFKGMMFSMMSFMLSKMMLLMKILEKKGGAGGIGGGGGDGGWAAAGGGGGAWMPAGGQDFTGGGGGYDANGQWQSRSIIEEHYNSPFKNNDKEITNFNTGERNNAEFDVKPENKYNNMPEISYVKPIVRYNNRIESEIVKNPVLVYKKSNVDFSNYPDNLNNDKGEDNVDTESSKRSKRSVNEANTYYKRPLDEYKEKRNENNKFTHNTKIRRKRSLDQLINPYTGIQFKRTNNAEYPRIHYNTLKDHEIVNNNNIELGKRSKRSILDILQNSYMYWMNSLLGTNNNRRTNFQRYKIINGIRYVYYPLKAQRPKMPKEVQLTSAVKVADEFKPIITAEDFNKGEIMEGAVESRMNKKKFHKIKETVNDTVEENPWE